jgi:hypothetical protein
VTFACLPRGAFRLFGLLALASLAGGCSLAMMQGPPADHQRRDDFYCTPYIGWPVVDGVGGLFLLGVATSAANGDTEGPPTSAPVEPEPPSQAEKAFRTVAVGATAAAALSAVYGLYQAGKCQQAVRLWQVRTAAKAKTAAPSAPSWPPVAAPDPWMVPPSGALPSPRAPTSAPAEQ